MKESTHQKVVLTQPEFFKVCLALESNKEWFRDKRPNVREAATKLSELTGLSVSQSAVRNVKGATGIDWVAKMHGGRPDRSGRSLAGDVRTLATALRHLYVELGIPPTDSLQELYNRVNSKGPVTTANSFLNRNGLSEL